MEFVEEGKRKRIWKVLCMPVTKPKLI